MIITKNKKEVKSGCEEMSPFGKDRQDKGLLTDIPYVRTSDLFYCKLFYNDWGDFFG